MWNCPAVKEWSRPTEAEREFRLRLVQASREERDQGVEALRAKYAPKLAAIQEQIRRARERLEREQAQASRSTWDATIALGSSVLGAFSAARTISKTNVTRATTAAKAASRAAQQRGDVGQAAGSLECLAAQTRRTPGQVPGGDRIAGRRAAARGPGARAVAAPPQEDRHHRRASRPGLDAS